MNQRVGAEVDRGRKNDGDKRMWLGISACRHGNQDRSL